MPRATYTMVEAGDGRIFKISGTGETRAAAIAEANAKLAMTVGVIQSGTISEDLAGDDLGTAHGAGLFSDANLVLRNTAGKVVNVHLENISTDLGTGSNGLLDLTDPLITEFAAAYVDGSGNGGYTPYDGKFVKAF